MRTMGLLLVIWGGLLIPLTLPWTWGYQPQLGLIGSFDGMTLRVMGDGYSYPAVVTVAVLLMGLGLTWIVIGFDLSRHYAETIAGGPLPDRQEPQDAVPVQNEVPMTGIDEPVFKRRAPPPASTGEESAGAS